MLIILKIRNFNKDLIIILFLFLLALFLRIPNYAKLSIMPDEILYSDYAYSIIAYDWGWPTRQMYAQPPLFGYILAILTYFFEGGLEVFRTVPIFFGILDVIAIYYLAKIIYSRWIGFISALLLAFSSYHILFSRTVMIETILIFFILMSMYYFWRTYDEDKLSYAVLTGIFLGMANNTKYASFLLYPIFIIYLLFINRKGFMPDWKVLFEKKFLIIIIISFLVFSPVLIELYTYEVNPFYWQLFERYEFQSYYYRSLTDFGITDLMTHGFDNYCGLLMDARGDIAKGFNIKSGSIATMNLPWLFLFEMAVYILLPVTILYYLYLSLKKQPQESFLLIAFLILNAFAAVFATRFQYYLLWNAPIFFIMLTKMSADLIKKLQNNNGISNINLQKSVWHKLIWIFILFLVGIFFVSYIYIGTLSPFVNESIKVGYEKDFLNIKNSISLNDSIATDNIKIMSFYLDKYDKEYVQVVQIYKYQTDRQNKMVYISVNLGILKEMKPKYIIVSVYSFSAYATIQDKAMIEKEYDLVSNENDVLLYERRA